MRFSTIKDFAPALVIRMPNPVVVESRNITWLGLPLGLKGGGQPIYCRFGVSHIQPFMLNL
jgi:hypothetical protein